MADLVGTQIAGYRIESLIARGGMGEVYRAEQDAPKRKVALKLLSPELSEDAGFRERFARESEAAASIDHPNVIPIYASGEADGALFIAMRFVEGTDLRTLLSEQGALPAERAVHICRQIADALEAAHERGLIHRDVKPANILVGRADHAYLSDFGLIRRSEVSTAITKTGQFMGTIDYVAPEQIKGEAVDGRADVYSLGCVLYECLTGDPPFRRETEVATLYAHLEDPPPVPSAKDATVSAGLDEVAGKAMAKRPDERYATAAELGTAIKTRAGPQMDPPLTPFPEVRRRHRLQIAAIVGVVLILAVAVGAIMLLSDSGEKTPSPPPSEQAVIAVDSLVQVDAESGEILNVEPDLPASFGTLPQVEIGEGGVWVVSGGQLDEFNPETGRSLGSVTISASGFLSAADLAIGSRTVLVATVPGVVRVNPATQQELRPVRLGPFGVEAAVDVAAGASSGWAVEGNGELTRFDPYTGRVTDRADVAQSASGLAVGFDSVWVIDDFGGTLTRIDPTSLKTQGVFEGDVGMDAIAVGVGAVWILDEQSGSVTPFNPGSESFGSSIRVGLDPTDLAVGLDAVWVANQGDGTVSMVDPVTSRADQIDVGAPASTIAVDERTRSLWLVVAHTQDAGA